LCWFVVSAFRPTGTNKTEALYDVTIVGLAGGSLVLTLGSIWPLHHVAVTKVQRLDHVHCMLLAVACYGNGA
jgi:hypothetical protein